VFSLFTQFDYQNYRAAWSGVSQQLLNTIVVAALSIVIGVAAAALGAYAFSQLRFRGKSLLFMAYVGLLLIPSTLTLIPLFLTIQKLHLFNTWWALILPYSATAQPLLVLIFRAFFDQIPRELLESARTDGCTEPAVLLRIVVPLTRPVLLTGAVLVTINVWGDYLWPTIVIQNPQHTTISAGVQQFIGSFGLNVSGGGSVFAAFVVATVPMFILVGFTMRYFVSGLTEGAIKL
jgi:ABC-type glycerol-3-phosphate transport system permease component